jgi:hypothetical protein
MRIGILPKKVDANLHLLHRLLYMSQEESFRPSNPGNIIRRVEKWWVKNGLTNCVFILHLLEAERAALRASSALGAVEAKRLYNRAIVIAGKGGCFPNKVHLGIIKLRLWKFCASFLTFLYCCRYLRLLLLKER